MRELASSYEQFEALGVGAAVLVTEGDQESARKMATSAKAPFPVMSDRQPSSGSASTVHERYGVSYGTVYLLDARRTVRWTFFGDRRRRPRVEVVLHQVKRMLRRDAEPGAADRARAGLKSRSVKEQLAALGLLEVLTPPEGLSAVIALLEDETPAVAVGAARVLRWYETREVVAPLARAAQAGDTETRRAAARALVHLGDNVAPLRDVNEFEYAEDALLLEAQEILLPLADQLLAEKDPELAVVGARLYWRLAKVADQKRLLGLLTHQDPRVRLAGVGGLSKRRPDAQALAELERLSKDPDPSVRGFAGLVSRQWRARLGRAR